MADSNEAILEMVRKQLRRENPPDTETLQARAAQIDESVRDLSLRQFNAKYVLRVRREMKRAEEEPPTPKAKRKKPEPTEEARVRVREVFLELARDVAEADRAGLIDVLTSIDEYVEPVLQALRE